MNPEDSAKKTPTELELPPPQDEPSLTRDEPSLEPEVVHLPPSEDPDEEPGDPHVPVRKTSGPVRQKYRRLTLAIDFGSSTLKAVALRPGTPAQVVWWGICEADSETGTFGEAEAAMVLRRWLKEIGQVHQVVISATQDQIFVRYFQLPVETEQEFRQAVMLEIQAGPDFQRQADRIEVLPLMRVQGDDVTGWMGLAYIVKEERLLRLYDQLKTFLKARIFIRPAVLGPAALYLPQSTTRSLALVDMGAKYTRISILNQGKICLVREVPTGSESLTRELMRTETDRAQAEFRKRHATLTSVADEFDQHSLAINGREVSVWSVHQWITDIRNTMAYFELHHQASVEDVVLLGGGAFLAALTEILELELKMPVKKATLPDFVNIACEQDLDWFRERYPRFAVAIGLALPQQPSAGILNLPVGKKVVSVGWRRPELWMAAGVVLLMAAGAFWPRMVLQQVEQEVISREQYLQELSRRVDQLELEGQQVVDTEPDIDLGDGIDIVRLLDWYAENLPAGAWLNSIQISRDESDVAQVKGQAIRLSDVRVLLQRMMDADDRPGRLLEFEAELVDSLYQFSAKWKTEK